MRTRPIRSRFCNNTSCWSCHCIYGRTPPSASGRIVTPSCSSPPARAPTLRSQSPETICCEYFLFIQIFSDRIKRFWQNSRACLEHGVGANGGRDVRGGGPGLGHQPGHSVNILKYDLRSSHYFRIVVFKNSKSYPSDLCSGLKVRKLCNDL